MAKFTKEEAHQIYEALKSAHEEITEMELTFADYVTTGRLLEQLEAAVTLVEGRLNGKA